MPLLDPDAAHYLAYTVEGVPVPLCYLAAPDSYPAAVLADITTYTDVVEHTSCLECLAVLSD